MIDTGSEQLLTLTQAARGLPNRNGRAGINVSTIWRWAKKGLHGVNLETILVGGIRFTSHEALQRFFAATTAAADRVAMPIRTPVQRQRAIEAAEKELADSGI